MHFTFYSLPSNDPQLSWAPGLIIAGPRLVTWRLKRTDHEEARGSGTVSRKTPHHGKGMDLKWFSLRISTPRRIGLLIHMSYFAWSVRQTGITSKPDTTDELIKIIFFGRGDRQTRVSSRKHEVYIGATWRIRLNDSCAAAMLPYVKII